MQHEQRLSAAIGMLDTLSARLSPVLGLSSVAVNAAAECCPETPLGIRIHDSTGVVNAICRSLNDLLERLELD